MIQQPRGVAMLVLHFEVVPKKVDMHRLKRGLWMELRKSIGNSTAIRARLRQRRLAAAEQALVQNGREGSANHLIIHTPATTNLPTPSPLQIASPALIQPDGANEEDVDEASLCKHSFRSTLAALPSFLPGTQLRETSVHLAFLCLLHLAHERSLVLTSEHSAVSSDLSSLFTDSDVFIQTEEEALAFPADPSYVHAAHNRSLRSSNRGLLHRQR